MSDRKYAELPAHIREAVHAIAQLHADHHKDATPLQRTLGSLTSILAHPWFVGMLTAVLACWIGGNLLADHHGWQPIDPPPFAWLEISLAVAALYMVILVYATQRRDDQLAQLRDQLTLELALLSEQKIAKVIQLLEEFRRDIPIVDNRVDEEAAAMAQSADPGRVLKAIKETHAEAEQINGPEAGGGFRSAKKDRSERR